MEERVGPYRLIRRLGQGGMGVVYLAEGSDHQEVALKVLRPHVAHDPIARARLQREATTLQKVSHPGVAGILDHDLEGDEPYLVTRFIPGRPLDEQVDERGPLTPRKWLPVAGCLAESLQAIHLAGVIHRDLKPGNVMMCNGRPVMIDFGIAQAADDLRLTQTGLVIGTPGYLAPELIEGETVSESADWWGWAATVAFAATGRRPFGKGPFEAVLHRVHSGQADLDGLDPRLKSLLAAALCPDRRDRPTQDEIMTGLNRYAEGRDALPPREKPTVVVAPTDDPVEPADCADDPGHAGGRRLWFSVGLGFWLWGSVAGGGGAARAAGDPAVVCLRTPSGQAPRGCRDQEGRGGCRSRCGRGRGWCRGRRRSGRWRRRGCLWCGWRWSRRGWCGGWWGAWWAGWLCRR